MKTQNRAFIDPSVVTPRELSNAEMSELSGGIVLTAVIWVSSCSQSFVMLTVAVGAEIID